MKRMMLPCFHHCFAITRSMLRCAGVQSGLRQQYDVAWVATHTGIARLSVAEHDVSCEHVAVNHRTLVQGGFTEGDVPSILHHCSRRTHPLLAFV